MDSGRKNGLLVDKLDEAIWASARLQKRHRVLLLLVGVPYQWEERILKKKAKNDQTKHGMEKTKSIQSQKTEDKIKEGTLKVDHGTDAMTVVLGKEKGGCARGVGSGVTYRRYFDLPRSRQASDKIILLLQSQLDNERRERQEKELLIRPKGEISLALFPTPSGHMCVYLFEELP
ncbi:hypothetical protein Tco_0077479 [Tanacetum coccineum]